MVDFYLDCGATGLTILGEATKLTAEESRRFAKTVLARVAGRVPVVLGASSPGFAPMRKLTESVMAMGAAGERGEVGRVAIGRDRQDRAFAREA